MNEYGFRIDNPVFNLFNNLQYTTLTKKVNGITKSCFKSEFYTSWIFKGQKEPLWNMTLELDMKFHKEYQM